MNKLIILINEQLILTNFQYIRIKESDKLLSLGTENDYQASW